MDCQVVRFVTLYEVLGLCHGCVMYVSLKRNVGDDLLQNDTTDFAGFRVPLDMVATFECLRQLGLLSNPSRQRAASRLAIL